MGRAPGCITMGQGSILGMHQHVIPVRAFTTRPPGRSEPLLYAAAISHDSMLRRRHTPCRAASLLRRSDGLSGTSGPATAPWAKVLSLDQRTAARKLLSAS